MTRLRDEMAAHAAKLAHRADGYRMCGARELARDCLRAAAALRNACDALDEVTRGETAACMVRGV